MAYGIFLLPFRSSDFFFLSIFVFYCGDSFRTSLIQPDGSLDWVVGFGYKQQQQQCIHIVLTVLYFAILVRAVTCNEYELAAVGPAVVALQKSSAVERDILVCTKLQICVPELFATIVATRLFGQTKQAVIRRV